MGRGLLIAVTLVVGCAALTFVASPAQAQPRIPVSIESTPPGAMVYLDNDAGAPIGVTPMRVARIRAGTHVLIFKLDNHETARLTVDVRRRRETFRVVLNPLGTLVVSAGNGDAQSAAVVIDGRPVGNIPYRKTMQPGRHQVEVRREGFRSFEQWVDLQGGQVYTLPVILERAAPETGSIMVAPDVPGAPVYLDGDPKGVTPTVIEDVPQGEHVLEIRPQGGEVHRQSVFVRAGERTSVTPSLRAAAPETAQLRVLTTPPGATISVDGEPVGQSPTTAAVGPGEHIVEALLAGHGRAQQTVTIEGTRQRVVSLQLQPEAQRPGRIVVNGTVTGAQVQVDGEDHGAPPVVIEDARQGTHAIRVTAPGYEDFRHTCRVAPGQDCEVMARMNPVGTPVRVEANVRGAEFYVDGELKGPVPFEGSVPVGSHRLEVRAEGYESHVEQVQLRPSSEQRVFSVALAEEGAVPPEERAEAMEARIRNMREATSYSAATLPPSMTTVDMSLGWPYILDLRLGVGIIDWLEAGFAMRSMFTRLSQFEGRVKAGWRPIEQIALGGQLRFGGGIGPSDDPTMAEEAAAAAAMADEPGNHKNNNYFLDIELLTTLHFSSAGAFTLWLGLDLYSDKWDFCGKNENQFRQRGGSGCAREADGADGIPDNDDDAIFRPGRQKQARLRLGGALEIVMTRHWNIFAILEGVVAGPSSSRRMYGNIWGIGGNDLELYFRLGLSYKFGRADQGLEEEGAGSPSGYEDDGASEYEESAPIEGDSADEEG